MERKNRMNRTLWKLQSIGERLWLLANMFAQQAAISDLRGIAVVADETRNMANKINETVELAMFEERAIQPEIIRELAFMLNLLALNCAIESHSIGEARSKAVAVCADDIRTLAKEIVQLFGDDAPGVLSSASPVPKNRLTSLDRGQAFIYLDIGGIVVAEPLGNIKEIILNYESEQCTDTHKNVRGQMLLRVEPHKRLGQSQATAIFAILRTPWANLNKTYAVSVNGVISIDYSPIGTPVPPPADMPLTEFVRECWENENGEPFYFMDWPKLANA
jgi:hypothetical protein